MYSYSGFADVAPSATYARLPTWARRGRGQYLHTITRHAMSLPFTNPALSNASPPNHYEFSELTMSLMSSYHHLPASSNESMEPK